VIELFLLFTCPVRLKTFNFGFCVMAIFTLQSVQKDFGIKEILKDASFSLDAGEKVGLIGLNGSGKSTLLKMIAGLEPIDGGQIQTNPSAKIIYLPQQPEVDEEKTLLEQVFADSGTAAQLVKEYEAVSDQLAHQPEDAALLDSLTRISHEMDTVGAWDLEAKAKVILTQLGITDFSTKMGQLSGGYRKRVALAAALVAEPDALLMDEPTNHLDALSVEWLQGYLQRYRGAVLLITHDRYFLDRVTQRIIEVDRANLYTYSGNYSYYLEKKAEMEISAASTQQKQAGILRKELAWLRRGAKARSTKQKARIGRVEEMRDREAVEDNGKVELSAASRRLGKKVVELANIRKTYGDRIIIKDFTYEFIPGDRVGIIGGNGMGKSTLLNIITNRLVPDGGVVDVGTTVHIGYFDQYSSDLMTAADEQLRAIDYLKEVGEYIKTADGTQITASQMLEKFLFTGNQQYAPIHMLSGGEKRRLYLLRVLVGAPNLLILDEPTNDLDIQTLSILEDYLTEFPGCVLVVSHDRYFLDRTVEKILALEGDGEIKEYPGNYSVYLDYQKQAESDAKAAKSPPKNLPKAQPSATPTTKKSLSAWEKRDLGTLEAKITKFEADKASLEAMMATASYGDLPPLTQQLQDLEQAIETTTTKWMALAERDN
jgi:ABC transport system ATP-binding/permease protein